MAIQVQLRRGTTAQNNAFTGAVGEVTVDTDKDTAVVHDGATAGGFPLVGEKGTQTITGVKTFANGLATDTISEETSAAGVTIDGVLLKDNGVVTGAGTVSAPVYSTTGDLNTGIFFPTADTIAFAEGGAEAMRITSDGNVGIGTNSPTDTNGFGKALDVQGTGGGALYVGSSGDRATYGYTSSELHIRNPSASGTTRFYINDTERARIDSSGNLLVGITSARANAGDVQVSKGISFPATQSAQSDANTLDDYEEGTWNGTVSAQNGTITTSTFSEGRYTKVGRLVTVSGRLVINDAGTGSGSIRITLPFTPANNFWSGSGNENISAGYTLAVFGTVDQLNIRKYDYATAIVNNHDFMFTATYAV